jgi:hypothetical protein
MSNNDDINKVINNIKTIINNIESRGINTPEKKEDYFWKNHSEIMNKYPFLVHQLCSNTDNSILTFMLEHLNKIKTGQLKQDDADKIVGEKLSDKYLPKNEN